MDTSTILAIVGVIVAIIIGGWQIWLASKQTNNSNKFNKEDNSIENKPATIVQASDQSVAIGTVEIEGNLSGNLQIGHTYNINVEEIASSTINKYREKPSAREIYDEIDQLPILQKEQARNSYVGLKVRWRATIMQIFPGKDDLVELMTRENGKYPYIYCKVSLLDYPEIRIAKDGHGIWIKGEIGSIDGMNFKLKNCSIELD